MAQDAAGTEIVIEKLMGMRTQAPSTITGQPDYLLNISFDKTGSWQQMKDWTRYTMLNVQARSLELGHRWNSGDEFLMVTFDTPNTYWHVMSQDASTPNTLRSRKQVYAYNGMGGDGAATTVSLGARAAVVTFGVPGATQPVTLTEAGSREVSFPPNRTFDVNAIPVDFGNSTVNTPPSKWKPEFGLFHIYEPYFLMVFPQAPRTTNSTLDPANNVSQNHAPYIIFLPAGPSSLANMYDPSSGIAGLFYYIELLGLQPDDIVYGPIVSKSDNFRDYQNASGNDQHWKDNTSGVEGDFNELEFMYPQYNVATNPALAFRQLQDMFSYLFTTTPGGPSNWLPLDRFNKYKDTDPTWYGTEKPTLGSRVGFAQLRRDGNFIYPSESQNPDPFFLPINFLPIGRISAHYAQRNWVAPDTTFTQRLSMLDPIVTTGVWRMRTEPEIKQLGNSPRRTIYYSEPESPDVFYERFYRVTFARSRGITALAGTAEGLYILGEKDALLLRGSSEADFSITNLDIPGCVTDLTSARLGPAVIYRGDRALYALIGGQAQSITDDIEDIVLASNPFLEQLTTDEAGGRLFWRSSQGVVYTFSLYGKGWSEYTTSVANDTNKLTNVGGGIPLFSRGNLLFGPYGDVMNGRISVRFLDAGDFTVYKNFTELHMAIESETRATIGMRVTPAVGAGNQVIEALPGKTVLNVVAGESLRHILSWRMANRIGAFLKLDINLTAANQTGTEGWFIRPNIRIKLAPSQENINFNL